MDLINTLGGEKDDINLAFSYQRLGTIYYGVGNYEKAKENLYIARNLIIGIKPGKRTF